MGKRDNTMIIFTSYGEKFKRLTDEEFGMLVRAMIDYQLNGTIPAFDNFNVSLSFDVVKADLDAVNSKYEEVCRKRSEAGKKGGAPIGNNNASKDKGNNQMLEETSKTTKNKQNNLKDKDKDNDNDNDNNTKKNVKEKDRVRHIYGEYKHVRLTDEEYNRLVADYGESETAGAIRILDEYCEQTGRSYKNHSLALRKWAFRALKEERGKTSTQEPKDNLKAIERLYMEGIRRG